MRKAYSIYSPPFEITSGGIRCLYGLYGHLLAKGEVAFINAKFDNPEQVIAIYPEIINGNPLGASQSVRYVLQTPGVMSFYGVPGPTTEIFKSDPQYKTDKIYVFSKIYDTFNVDDSHLLFLPIINLKVFKDQRKKRTKTCYLVGKGNNSLKHPQDSIELTREFAVDQQALADLLNECRTIYVYDRLSAMMDIARLCGVRVKYYGDFSLNELKNYETGLNGLGYFDNDEELNTELFRAHYENLVHLFNLKLDRFIEETQ